MGVKEEIENRIKILQVEVETLKFIRQERSNLYALLDEAINLLQSCKACLDAPKGKIEQQSLLHEAINKLLEKLKHN